MTYAEGFQLRLPNSFLGDELGRTSLCFLAARRAQFVDDVVQIPRHGYPAIHCSASLSWLLSFEKSVVRTPLRMLGVEMRRLSENRFATTRAPALQDVV
jgi:hypothetical protein